MVHRKAKICQFDIFLAFLQKRYYTATIQTKGMDHGKEKNPI